MTTSQLVPVLAERVAGLANIPPLGAGPPGPEEMAAFEAFHGAVNGYVPPETDVANAVAPGPHGDVPVRIYSALDGRRNGGFVWAHGGGFIFGDLDMPESNVVAREVVARTGAVVVAVDYRLCHGGVHFPGPHDDVHAAFVWAATSSGLLPPGSAWALGGASAGGNLAAGVAQRLRDEGQPEVSGLVLAYPVLHDPLPPGDDDHARCVGTLPIALRFTPDATTFLNRNFLGEHPSTVPYAFAGLASLEGMPRTMILVCEFDDLRPSGELFARQLADAGVDVELDFVRGVTHGHLSIPGLAESLASLDDISRFVGGPR